MDARHFDRLTQGLSRALSRRRLGAMLAAGLSAGLAVTDRAGAGRKRGRKKKPKGCRNGKAQCGGACVDTQTNPDHCGGCRNECTFDDVCVGGTCCRPNGATCGAGGITTLCCSGNCVPGGFLNFCR